ncbi:MAG: hypothetical protein LQ347_001890, partial [Umbilicaria vellea]
MQERKERDRREAPQGFRNYHLTPPPRYELPVRAAQPHETRKSVSGNHCGRPRIGPNPQPHQNFINAPDMLTRNQWNPYSRETGANHVLSPPVSPSTKPSAIAPRVRDPRERSPTRNQAVKAERHPQPNLHPSLSPDPLLEDGEITSSSMSMTPRPEGPNRPGSLTDGPNYVLYGRPTPRE